MEAAGLEVDTVDVTGAVTQSTTVTPAVSAAQGAPESYAALAGTVTYNDYSFDLGSVHYTGAVTAQDYLDRLDAAARPALGTGVTPLCASATALLFGGDTPGATSTATDAAVLTPSCTGQSGASAAIFLIDNAIDWSSSGAAA